MPRPSLVPLLFLCLSCNLLTGETKRYDPSQADSDVAGLIGVSATDVRCQMVGETRRFTCAVTVVDLDSSRRAAAKVGASALSFQDAEKLGGMFVDHACTADKTTPAWYTPPTGDAFGDWWFVALSETELCITSQYLD